MRYDSRLPAELWEDRKNKKVITMSTPATDEVKWSGDTYIMLMALKHIFYLLGTSSSLMVWNKSLEWLTSYCDCLDAAQQGIYYSKLIIKNIVFYGTVQNNDVFIK